MGMINFFNSFKVPNVAHIKIIFVKNVKVKFFSKILSLNFGF